MPGAVKGLNRQKPGWSMFDGRFCEFKSKIILMILGKEVQL